MRQERVAAASSLSGGYRDGGGAAGEEQPAAAAKAELMTDTATPVCDAEGINHEDILLQQALAMSMAEGAQASEEGADGCTGEEDVAAMDKEGGDDDDATMQMALAMSIHGEKDEKTTKQGQQPTT